MLVLAGKSSHDIYMLISKIEKFQKLRQQYRGQETRLKINIVLTSAHPTGGLATYNPTHSI